MKKKIVFTTFFLLVLSISIKAQKTIDKLLEIEVKLEDSISSIQKSISELQTRISDTYTSISEAIEKPVKIITKNPGIIEDFVDNSEKEKIRLVNKSTTISEIIQLKGKLEKVEKEQQILEKKKVDLSELIVQNDELDKKISELRKDTAELSSKLKEIQLRKQRVTDELRKLKKDLIQNTNQDSSTLDKSSQMLSFIYDENINQLTRLLKGDFTNMDEIEAVKQRIPEKYFSDKTFKQIALKYENYKTASQFISQLRNFTKNEYNPAINYADSLLIGKKIIIALLESSQSDYYDQIFENVENFCLNNNKFYDYIKDNFSSFSKSNRSKQEDFIDKFKIYNYEYLEKEFWNFYEGVIENKYTSIDQCNIRKFICN